MGLGKEKDKYRKFSSMGLGSRERVKIFPKALKKIPVIAGRLLETRHRKGVRWGETRKF